MMFNYISNRGIKKVLRKYYDELCSNRFDLKDSQIQDRLRTSFGDGSYVIAEEHRQVLENMNQLLNDEVVKQVIN